MKKNAAFCGCTENNHIFSEDYKYMLTENGENLFSAEPQKPKPAEKCRRKNLILRALSINS